MNSENYISNISCTAEIGSADIAFLAIPRLPVICTLHAMKNMQAIILNQILRTLHFLGALQMVHKTY